MSRILLYLLAVILGKQIPALPAWIWSLMGMKDDGYRIGAALGTSR